MHHEPTSIAAAPSADTAIFVGKFGLYFFALSLWLSTSGSHLALGLLLLATLMDREGRAALARDPMLKVLALFALYLALHAAVALWGDPHATKAVWAASWQWLKPLLVFFILAWWMGGDERRVVTALLLAFFGLVVKILLAIEVTGVSAFLTGGRSGLGYTPTFLGLFTATALLGLLVLAPRLHASSRTRLGLAFGAVAWSAALIILVQCLIVSQARNTWIAVLIIYPLTLLTALGFELRGRAKPRIVPAALMTLLAVAVAGAMFAHNWHTIKQRATQEPATWRALLDGNLDDIAPTGSIGARVRIMEYGFDKWLERPIFGWGPAASPQLIHQAVEPELHGLAHFHNTYLELLVGLGLVGAAFMVFVLASLGWIMWRALRAGVMSFDIALYALGAGGLLAIAALSDFGLPQVAWKLHCAMLAAVVYGYRFRLSGRGAATRAAPLPS